MPPTGQEQVTAVDHGSPDSDKRRLTYLMAPFLRSPRIELGFLPGAQYGDNLKLTKLPFRMEDAS